MAYIPTSTNPLITTPMLQQALYTVRLEDGPEDYQYMVKRRYGFRLVLDSFRKRLYAVFGVNNEEIVINLDLHEVVSFVCLDAGQIKEDRHRLQLIMRNGDVYSFYVDIPYQFDPLPFIARVNQQVDFAQHPENERRSNRMSAVGSLICCIVFAIWTIVDWTNGGSIGWGIITLFLSICCGVASKQLFSEWNK